MAATGEATVSPSVGPSEALYKKLSPGPGRSAAEVAEHQRMRIEGAMLKIVAERGYSSVTMRELARVAGVSSRAFYQHYSSKEDCFLRTHESAVRRIARRVAAAQAGEPDWRECLRITIDTYLGELQRDLPAAQLILIDAYVAGSVALKQVRWAEQTLEARIIDCFESGASRSALPPLVAKGIAVAVICAARFHLVRNKKPVFRRQTDELTSWASAVFNTSSMAVPQESISPRSVSTEPSDLSIDGRPRWAASDERGLIVSALAKLAAVEGYEELTVRKIRTSAGASSKKFTAHFGGVADCFQNTVDVYVESIAFDQSSYGNSTHTAERRTEDPIAFLCTRVAQDPTLATLGFIDIFGPGPQATRSLEQFINQIGVLLNYGERALEVPAAAPEISAAAVWGAIREEIICERRCQLPDTAPLLRKLSHVSTDADKEALSGKSEALVAEHR